MTPDFSNLVYPVITTALDIRDRVERGDPLDLEKERGRLIELLPANVASGLQAGYSGDGRIFLGARYALACWIDELFIVHSSWAERWKPVTLELALFGTRERATRFWEQADIVLGRPGAPKPPDRPGDDALETFFLCIVLGFRGTYAEDAAKVREYVEEMRGRSRGPPIGTSPPSWASRPTSSPSWAARPSDGSWPSTAAWRSWSSSFS